MTATARTIRRVYRNGTWYLNRSTAGFSAIPFGLSTDQPVQADYDGDGKDDLAVFRASAGTWYAIKSTDGSVAIIPFGTDGRYPGTG